MRASSVTGVVTRLVKWSATWSVTSSLCAALVGLASSCAHRVPVDATPSPEGGVGTDTGVGTGTGTGPSDTASAEPLPLPWLDGLFDPNQTRVYDWSFEVDVHDEEGSVATVSGTLSCMSELELRTVAPGRAVWVACQVCEESITDGELEIEPDLDECFVVTNDGLWIVEEAPESDDELTTLLATEAYLSAAPVEGERRATEEDDGFVYELGVSITAREGGWCRTDSSSEMYGSETTRCFGPGPGLVSVSMDGRSGPSQESYFLVSATRPAG